MCMRRDLDPRAKLQLNLVAGVTGKSLPGLVQILDRSGRPVPLEGLLPRGFGLSNPARWIHSNWSVLPGRTTLRLPREKLTIEAFQGIETEIARAEIDLAKSPSAEIQL